MRFVNNLKTTFLLSSLMALCMLVGHFAGGAQGVIFGFVFGGAGALVAFFFSDRIAILAHGGQEIQRSDLPWFHDMIQDLATRAGLPMPRIYLCPQDAPNAFATGRSPSHAAVAITRGMLERFPKDEIEGVMAHELAHVRHRDMLTSTIASVMGGMISQLPYMLVFFGGGSSRDSREGNPLAAIGMIATIVLAPLAAILIQMAISRQREYAADSYGGELSGDPLKLARALNRLTIANERIPTDTNPSFHNLYIVQPLSAGGMASLFSTHPPIEKRIARLQEQAARLR